LSPIWADAGDNRSTVRGWEAGHYFDLAREAAGEEQTMRVTGEIVIERPIDEVFDFVADERNEPQYNPQDGSR
jgi:uncharacterized membrane protein